ncbi:metallophosphoesterase [Methanobacterium sp. VT]|uniref:Phosphoesterase n=2 Tax=Methanobacterium spitsbergense TaxID=2874285 RepID=A0A8T5UM08_9EURY|nr:metallophosphoesterase [Methanobacterium spitsbergense]MBZ2164912.1 metallophosphoesterase [Methanobacterium spitsbergense]
MIGIMSDSHDNLDAIRKAVKIFNKEEIDVVIHAGDLISPFTALEFRKLDPELVAIYGNNDGEKEGLKAAYEEICILEDFKEISVEGWKFSIIHGSNQAIVDSLAKCGKYDVVIRGHTHKMEILNGETMIINPGEVCGYVSGQKTVVLLDTDDLSFEVIYI